jgi:hypothetical protein
MNEKNHFHYCRPNLVLASKRRRAINQLIRHPDEQLPWVARLTLRQPFHRFFGKGTAVDPRVSKEIR